MLDRDPRPRWPPWLRNVVFVALLLLAVPVARFLTLLVGRLVHALLILGVASVLAFLAYRWVRRR